MLEITTKQLTRKDGLNKESRQALYNPLTYRVERKGPNEFALRNECNGAEFYVWAVEDGYRVRSNTGGITELNLGLDCPCPDAYKIIARKEERSCKHVSVVLAVHGYMQREKELEKETRKERTLRIGRELEEMFGR